MIRVNNRENYQFIEIHESCSQLVMCFLRNLIFHTNCVSFGKDDSIFLKAHENILKMKM